MPTLVYFFALLACFVAQYVCDARSIEEAAVRRHWTVHGIRWSPFAPFGPKNGWERCYFVRFEDQHGRTSTRACRITGVIGLPMEAAFDPATVVIPSPSSEPRNDA
jgi:hypothetical protein